MLIVERFELDMELLLYKLFQIDYLVGENVRILMNQGVHGNTVIYLFFKLIPAKYLRNLRIYMDFLNFAMFMFGRAKILILSLHPQEGQNRIFKNEAIFYSIGSIFWPPLGLR